MRRTHTQVGTHACITTYNSGSPNTKTSCPKDYRGTSLVRKRTTLGPYRRPMARVRRGSYGGGRLLMGEVPLYTNGHAPNR